MGLAGWVAVAVAVVAVVLVVRGWDVRLVLLSASLVIASAAGLTADAGRLGPLAAVVREFLATFSNEKFVVPICSAMGFAYVLRYTGCERHLVLLLVKPLRSVRWLLIPGVVLVGFLVNIPVISQTSTAVCIGPVVVPLMRAAGYSMATIGACLLLGASVGGELLNPGAPELLTVSARTKVETLTQVRNYLPQLVFTQLAVAGMVVWVMSIWWERKSPSHLGREDDLLSPDGKTHGGGGPLTPHPATPGGEGDRINYAKAFVPVVPIALLFASGGPDEYRLFKIPDDWVILSKDGKSDPAYSSRLIGLAMLVGVLVAMVVTPGKARGCVKHFFDGAGYGFANIVSLIVTATCFGKAIEVAGLATAVSRVIARAPDLMQPLAALVPLGFAAVCGSGMASTQSLYTFFYDPAVQHGHDPTAVGAMVAIGSAAGRTMSPVAAVTLMCATLTGTNPFTLARRVAVPLLVGIAVVIALRVGGLI
ncbi:MAG: dcuD [Gemmataceae bacterium]|nr:dcuD [Gemmataceae bacterium]